MSQQSDIKMILRGNSPYRPAFVIWIALLLAGPYATATHARGAQAESGEQTRLVFRAAPDLEGKKATDDAMQATVRAVQQRVDVLIEGGSTRRLGKDRIEVVVPTTDPERVTRIRKFLSRSGTLEFAILANRRDHAEVIAAARKVDQDYRDDQGRLIARWMSPARDETEGVHDLGPRGEVATRESEEDGRKILQYLVIFQPDAKRLTGDYLAHAEESRDESGRPGIDFEFNRLGAELMADLTRTNQPTIDGFERRLAIIIDGRIHQAPGIRTQISARGQLTGLEKNDAAELIALLRLGTLPLPVDQETD